MSEMSARMCEPPPSKRELGSALQSRSLFRPEPELKRRMPQPQVLSLAVALEAEECEARKDLADV